MNKKYMALFISLILLLMMIVYGVTKSGPVNNGDGKEPELGGSPSISVDGNTKLQSMLEPEQFSAANNELATYVIYKYGKALPIKISKTILDTNGVIRMFIVTSEEDKFEAQIQSTEDRFIFRVPSADYITTTSQATIRGEYHGY